MKKFYFCLLNAVVCMGLLACSTPEESQKTLKVEEVYGSDQCSAQIAGNKLLSTEEALRLWWKPLSANQLPVKNLPDSLAATDFDAYQLFVINLGPRPSTGFGVQLTQSEVGNGNNIKLFVQETRPEEGRALPQQMTSPCVVVRLPKGKQKYIELEWQ